MVRKFALLSSLLLCACANSVNNQPSTPPVAKEHKSEPVAVKSKQSTVEEKIKCVEYGKANYQDKQFDDGYIEFEYYYSPVLDTCVLQREEFGPEATQYVYKLYDMFTKGILLHYSTFEGIGCSFADKCVKTMTEYNAMKNELLGK